MLSGHHGILRIVRLGNGEQCLQGQQNSSDGHSGRPLVFEYVQANGPSGRTNVWMPDSSRELDL